MTTPQQLIYNALGKPACDIAEAPSDSCAFCAAATGVAPIKKVFGDGFTNWDRLRNPAGNAICEACWTCFRSEHARKLRTSSWVVSPNKLMYLKRGEIASALFGVPEPPFCFYVTTSFKKLGAAKVQLNYDLQYFVVQFEELPATVDVQQHTPLFAAMSEFYAVPAGDADKFATYQASLAEAEAEEGEEEKKKKSPPSAFFTKEEIRTGEYQPHRIREYGLEEWRETEKRFAEFRGSPTWELFVFALNLTLSKRDRKENSSEKKSGNRKTRGKPAVACERQVPAGGGADLQCLAFDRMGQGLFWSPDENL